MIAKHKGTRNEHWKPLADQAQPVRRMLTAPMLAATMPDWAVSALASQVGVDASALLVVGLATVAGVVRGATYLLRSRQVCARRGPGPGGLEEEVIGSEANAGAWCRVRHDETGSPRTPGVTVGLR